LDINKDNIASYWAYEILQQTDMTFGELIYRVDFIKRNGHGKYLASTNSNRIALAHVADDYGAKLTDGWFINNPHELLYKHYTDEGVL